MVKPPSGMSSWGAVDMNSASWRDGIAAEGSVGKPRLTREPSGGWLVTVPYGGARHLLYAFPSWRSAVAALPNASDHEAMRARVEHAWYVWTAPPVRTFVMLLQGGPCDGETPQRFADLGYGPVPQPAQLYQQVGRDARDGMVTATYQYKRTEWRDGQPFWVYRWVLSQSLEAA